MIRPINTEDPQELSRVTLRTSDNLPAHVKGLVVWHEERQLHAEGQSVTFPAGYYIPSDEPGFEDTVLVEFLANQWFQIYISHEGQFFTCFNDQIDPYTRGTGYWYQTEPQHPYYRPEAGPSAPSHTNTPIITLNIQSANKGHLTRDPAILPFVTAQAHYSDDSEGDQSSGNRSAEELEESLENLVPTQVPSVQLSPLEQAVLTTQFEHGLDIKDSVTVRFLPGSEPGADA